MTIDEKKSKVAEACGYERMEGISKVNTRTLHWIQFKGQPIERKVVSSELPDYPNDLNACHEMEKALTGEQWNCYLGLLERSNTEIARRDIHVKIGVHASRVIDWILAHATAAQRFEAFGLTLCLWKEGE